MAQSLEEPQQHKQPSRKGKRAWRKHIDVTDIQVGLDSVHDEEIKGGIIAEKPSEALFTLDTTGSDSLQKSHNKHHKPLKVDQILAQRSAVPALDTRVRSKAEDGIYEPNNKRRKNNGVSHKEYERLREIAYGGESVRKITVKTDGTPDYDPWAVDDDEEDGHDPTFSYLEKPKPIKAPQTLKTMPISLIANKKEFPAITMPKPGTSYNPVFQDWDKLLSEEGQREVEAERKRLREQEEEDDRSTRALAAQDGRDDWFTEDESMWEGFESEYESQQWSALKRPERKTPTEKKKARRKKEAERQAKWDMQMKKRTLQAQHIREIAKQVNREAKARVAKEVTRDDSTPEELDDRTLRRRKLGRAPVPERLLELVLPEELQESLRLLKPEGNLLKDRYRSVLVRGKIESRRRITQPKKAKRSYTEKWTYKDFQTPSA